MNLRRLSDLIATNRTTLKSPTTVFVSKNKFEKMDEKYYFVTMRRQNGKG
jgi:hypothetical protein